MPGAVGVSVPGRRERRGSSARVSAAFGGMWAAVTGAAPHVLHHVGPLAGAAIVSGVTGGVVFALVGFLLTIPLLRRIHRHTRSWTAPTLALAALVGVYLTSSFVIAPRLTSSDESGATSPPSQQQDSAAEHAGHHGG